jgi:hypothetical protein
MASTYSQYKIELVGTGEQAGTWGTTTNNNFGSATPGTYQGFEQAIGGRADVTMSGTTTLSLTNSNAAQDARALYLNLSGTLSGAADLVVPALQKSYLVKNGTTGGFAVTIKVIGQTGVSIPNGKTVWVYNNGTDVVTAVDFIPEIATTTVDATNIEVTNIKAKDGTSAGSIADSTGVVTLASSVLTTTDINGGTIDGTAIGGSTPAAVSATTLNTSGQVVFNDAGADVDFRVEGDTVANLLFVDASTDRVGIGTDTPTQTLSLDGYLSVNSNNISADNSLGFRNRIINGDMRIDQRNAGASVTPSNADYTLDRYQSVLSAASKYSIQQVSDAPTGFVNSLRVTSSSAYAVSADEVFQIRQSIEGTNCSDLAFGSASAKTVTLSFWVRSSLTGTFGGRIQNSAGDRNYPFSYTISIADTWEYKTVTIAGDTTGTWLTTTGIGIQIRWSLGSGSDFQGTAGSWTASNISSVTGETQVVATNGATWYVTGVQLEVGSVATPFERRPYGTELSLCQRYYQQLELNATGSADFKYMDAARGAAFNASIVYPVEMRTSPTIAFTGTQTYTNSSGLAAAGTSAYSTRLNVSVTGAGQYRVINGNVTISAEL